MRGSHWREAPGEHWWRSGCCWGTWGLCCLLPPSLLESRGAWTETPSGPQMVLRSWPGKLGPRWMGTGEVREEAPTRAEGCQAPLIPSHSHLPSREMPSGSRAWPISSWWGGPAKSRFQATPHPQRPPPPHSFFVVKSSKGCRRRVRLSKMGPSCCSGLQDLALRDGWREKGLPSGVPLRFHWAHPPPAPQPPGRLG